MEPSASSKALSALIKEQQDQYRAARNGAKRQGKAGFVRRADLELSPVARARASASAGSPSSSNGCGSALNNQNSKKRQRDSSHDNISSAELLNLPLRSQELHHLRFRCAIILQWWTHRNMNIHVVYVVLYVQIWRHVHRDIFSVIHVCMHT